MIPQHLKAKIEAAMSVICTTYCGWDFRPLLISTMRKGAELALEDLPRWIPVTEKLPDAGDTVFVSMRKPSGYTYTQLADMDSGRWLDDMDRNIERGPDHWTVTHWMPLPEPANT